MKMYAFAILILFVASCQRERQADILVSVKYDGGPIEQPVIYLTMGRDTSFQVPPSAFLRQISGDAIGQGYFSDLSFDTYTISAIGYSQKRKKDVLGKTIIQLSNETYYEVTVNLQ